MSNSASARCSDVKAQCLNNTACNVLYSYFAANCSDVLAGLQPDCPAECNSTWTDLLAMESRFLLCQCDAADYSCKSKHENIEYACFRIAPKSGAQCTFPSSPPKPTSLLCEDVITDCLTDSDCKAARNAFYNNYVCQAELRGGAGSQCSSPCRQRLLDFLCNPFWMEKSRGCICARDDPGCFTDQYELEILQGVCLNDTHNIASLVPSQNCINTRLACSQDDDCTRVIAEVEKHCADLLVARTTTCSPLCKESFAELERDPVGHNLIRCACFDHSQCNRQGAFLIYYCKGIINDVPENCNHVLDSCSTEAVCNASLPGFRDSCAGTLPSLDSCPVQCSSAVKSLYDSPIGARLDYCYCSESDNQCISYQSSPKACLSLPGTTSSSPTPTGGGAQDVGIRISFIAGSAIFCLLAIFG